MEKHDKIAIVGSGLLGSDFGKPVKLKYCDVPKQVIVIEDTKKITINGVEYERIPQPPKPTGRKAEMLAMMEVMMYVNPYGGYSKPSKPLPTDNIEAEFELIQQKKSKLSRADRDRVEVAFKRVYREVKK